MIEASKSTREVQKTVTEETYTLTLSGSDVAAFKQEYADVEGALAYGVLMSTLTAIRTALTAAPEVAKPEPSVGDTVRVLEDDPTSRTGEFVGKVGKIVRVTPASRLPYTVEFPGSEGAPYKSWSVARIEKVSTPGLRPGDRIRILEDGHASAGVSAGDVLTVTSVACGEFTTNNPGSSYAGSRWYFELDDEGTGWERYAPEATRG